MNSEQKASNYDWAADLISNATDALDRDYGLSRDDYNHRRTIALTLMNRAKNIRNGHKWKREKYLGQVPTMAERELAGFLVAGEDD